MEVEMAEQIERGERVEPQQQPERYLVIHGDNSEDYMTEMTFLILGFFSLYAAILTFAGMNRTDMHTPFFRNMVLLFSTVASFALTFLSAVAVLVMDRLAGSWTPRVRYLRYIPYLLGTVTLVLFILCVVYH